MMFVLILQFLKIDNFFDFGPDNIKSFKFSTLPIIAPSMKLFENICSIFRVVVGKIGRAHV